MSVISSREEVGDALFSQVSNIEPELAEFLIDFILEMDDEAIIRIKGDADALQRLVKNVREASLEGVVALDEEEMPGLDDMVAAFHSSSNSARWSPTPESIIQRAAIVTEREDAYFGPQRGRDTLPRSSCQTENEESPVTNDPQRQERIQRVLDLTGLDSMEELVASHFERMLYEEEGFVESPRDPAQWNTMKEVVASPATLPGKGAPAETVWRSGGPIPLVNGVQSISYFDSNGKPVFPVRTTPQKNSGKKSCEAHRPRAPKREAADRNHPLAETEAPARMPPMEAVRQFESPRRAPQPPRRSKPASTGAKEREGDDCVELEAAAVGGFLCGVFLMTCCIVTCS